MLFVLKIFIEVDNLLKKLNPNIEMRNPKQSRIIKIQITQTGSGVRRISNLLDKLKRKRQSQTKITP
jgi:hypothetical protein